MDVREDIRQVYRRVIEQADPSRQRLEVVTALIAVGLTCNAQVCMRQWSPELIAKRAREVAEEILSVCEENEHE